MPNDTRVTDDRPRINIGHLLTLALVAEHRSFTRAAEALGISQPSVSQQIHELERATGLPLVAVQGRSLAVTPLGTELAEIGRRIAVERERASRAVERHREGSAGRLTIAASRTTSAYVLPELIARLTHEHPAALVELRVENSFDVAQLVSDDLADLGTIEGDVERPELVIVPFSRDRLICIAHPRHPLTQRTLEPGDVESETLLVRESGSGTRAVVLRTLAAQGFRFARTLAFGTNETIKEGAAKRLGIAWLSHAAVRAQLEAGTLCELRFSTPEIHRDFCYVRRRDAAPAPLTQAFIALLESYASEAETREGWRRG